MGQYHCPNCQEYLEKARYYHQLMERYKCCDDKRFMHAYKRYCHYCKKAAACQRRYPQPTPHYGYSVYPGFPIASP